MPASRPPLFGSAGRCEPRHNDPQQIQPPDESTTMTDNNRKAERAATDTITLRLRGRRRLLGVLAAGGAVGSGLLPDQWHRPVIDTAALPAHAEGTPSGLLRREGLVVPGNGSVGRGVLDTFVGTAEAQNGCALEGDCVVVQVDQQSGNGTLIHSGGQSPIVGFQGTVVGSAFQINPSVTLLTFTSGNCGGLSAVLGSFPCVPIGDGSNGPNGGPEENGGPALGPILQGSPT